MNVNKWQFWFYYLGQYFQIAQQHGRPTLTVLLRDEHCLQQEMITKTNGSYLLIMLRDQEEDDED